MQSIIHKTRIQTLVLFLFMVAQAAGVGGSNGTPQRQTNAANPSTVSVRDAIEMKRIVGGPLPRPDDQKDAVVMEYADIHQATELHANEILFRY